MKPDVSQKIFADIDLAIKKIELWKDQGYEVVFTNGCFDVLHRGHIEVIEKASEMGDFLILGLNSDQSVKRLKGRSRPIMSEENRAYLLASITFVDMVIIFKEDTPQKLIESILPDVLVKGGDYKIKEVVGGDIVKNHGGKVEIVKLLEGFSTSGIIEKINN